MIDIDDVFDLFGTSRSRSGQALPPRTSASRAALVLALAGLITFGATAILALPVAISAAIHCRLTRRRGLDWALLSLVLGLVIAGGWAMVLIAVGSR